MHPETFLVRFYGMYRVKMHHLNRKVHFIVMNRWDGGGGGDERRRVWGWVWGWGGGYLVMHGRGHMTIVARGAGGGREAGAGGRGGVLM